MDYRAEDDLHALHRAAEIHSDPKRITAARKLHVKRTSAMKKFMGGSRSLGG